MLIRGNGGSKPTNRCLHEPVTYLASPKRPTPMTEELILSHLHQLPESWKQEVLHYVEFLLSKLTNDPAAATTPAVAGRGMMFGSARGKYIMSDDFNEPLDDFKEYM